MTDNAMQIMWQQAQWTDMIIAFICGAVVGFIYLQSLRWSLNHWSEFKHKYAMYTLTALARITLFFGVLAVVAHRNAIIVIIYLAAFLLTRFIFLVAERKRFGVNHKIYGEK